MPTYNTPGVYVEEVSTLPPSVAEVATAIPAFLGYTEKGTTAKAEVAEINSLLEFEQRFGKAEPTEFTIDASDVITPAGPSMPVHFLYYAVSLYFKNGGGRCYVVSIGNYADEIGPEAFSEGLKALEREDEPTLIVMPELVGLEAADFTASSRRRWPCRAASATASRSSTSRTATSTPSAPASAPATSPTAPPTTRTSITSLTHRYDEATLVAIKVGSDDKKLAAIAQDRHRPLQPPQEGARRPARDPPAERRDRRHLRPHRPRARRVEGARQRQPDGVIARPPRSPRPSRTASTSTPPPASRSTRSAPSPARARSCGAPAPSPATTTSGATSHVRRLFITIEESARKATSFAVFEPNDATTWLKVKGMIESYLYGLWEQGALAGRQARGRLSTSTSASARP
jgi:hypothetical protein